MSIRMAASCGHPLHVKAAPRGARTTRSVTRSSSLNSIPLATPPRREVPAAGGYRPRYLAADGGVNPPGGWGCTQGRIGGLASCRRSRFASSVDGVTGMIVTSLAAAGLYGAAAALEQRQAERAPEESAGKFTLLVHLARNPLWLLGFAAQFGGFAVHAAALRSGPLDTVQMLI